MAETIKEKKKLSNLEIKAMALSRDIELLYQESHYVDFEIHLPEDQALSKAIVAGVKQFIQTVYLERKSVDLCENPFDETLEIIKSFIMHYSNDRFGKIFMLLSTARLRKGFQMESDLSKYSLITLREISRDWVEMEELRNNPPKLALQAMLDISDMCNETYTGKANLPGLGQSISFASGIMKTMIAEGYKPFDTRTVPAFKWQKEFENCADFKHMTYIYQKEINNEYFSIHYNHMVHIADHFYYQEKLQNESNE